jgi:hypothetical protein
MCPKSFLRFDNLKRHCSTIHHYEVPKRFRAYLLDSNDDEYDPENRGDVPNAELDFHASRRPGSSYRCSATSIVSVPKQSAVAGQRSRIATKENDEQVDHFRNRSPTPPPVSENLQQSMYMHGDVPLAEFVSIKAAVKIILERHDDYSIPGLSSFIESNFREIPKEVIPYVVLAATEGAKHVAKSYQIRQTYLDASQPHQIQTAKKMLRNQ